jgi:hypothetical protein
MNEVKQDMSLDRTTKNYAIYSSKDKAIFYMPIELAGTSAAKRISIVATEVE